MLGIETQSLLSNKYYMAANRLNALQVIGGLTIPVIPGCKCDCNFFTGEAMKLCMS